MQPLKFTALLSVKIAHTVNLDYETAVSTRRGYECHGGKSVQVRSSWPATFGRDASPGRGSIKDCHVVQSRISHVFLLFSEQVFLFV